MSAHRFRIRFLLLVALTAVCLFTGRAATRAQTPDADPETLTAREILKRASARIAETQSLSFSLEIEGTTFVDAEETIQLLEASGELARPDRVHATFKVKVLDNVTVTTEIITIGDQTWTTDLVTGNWSAAPAEFTYNPSILFDQQDGVGPVMDRVTNAERLDDEDVHDRDAFHVRATVDHEVIGPLTSHTMTGAPITVDLWIDQTTFDLLRARLSESEADGAGEEPAVWTLDLDHHDKGFEIEPPDTSS